MDFGWSRRQAGVQITVFGLFGFPIICWSLHGLSFIKVSLPRPGWLRAYFLMFFDLFATVPRWLSISFGTVSFLGVVGSMFITNSQFSFWGRLTGVLPYLVIVNPPSFGFVSDWECLLYLSFGRLGAGLFLSMTWVHFLYHLACWGTSSIVGQGCLVDKRCTSIRCSGLFRIYFCIWVL